MRTHPFLIVILEKFYNYLFIIINLVNSDDWIAPRLLPRNLREAQAKCALSVDSNNKKPADIIVGGPCLERVMRIELTTLTLAT